MALHVRAKVLLHVWSYDFYNDVIHWITVTSCDIWLFSEFKIGMTQVCDNGDMLSKIYN